MAKKKKTKFTPSNGKKKGRDARRRIKVLERKVKRWDRYRKKGKKVSKNNSRMSRAKQWNTDGLQRQIEFLRNIA